MITIIEKFVHTLRGVEYWVTVPLFALMLGIMLLQVICRYILEIPLAFSEELSRFLFAGCTFLGAAIATANRSHIEINFTELAIGRWIKSPAGQMKAAIFMNVVRDVGTIVCLAIVGYETDVDRHGLPVLDCDGLHVPGPDASHRAQSGADYPQLGRPWHYGL